MEQWRHGIWNDNKLDRYHESDDTPEDTLRVRKALIAMFAFTLTLVACNDGFDLPEPARMEKIDGDNQRATAGNRLSVPLSVQITASDGSAVPREKVRWEVTQGVGGAVSDSITVTDGNGLAQAYMILGPTAGEYSVTAALERKPDAVVTFDAEAVSAPTITAINPANFEGGDEISLQGSHLSDSMVVEFDGSAGTIAVVSPTGTGATVVVPGCLVPGSVTVSARVGLSGRSSVTGTFVSTSDPLQLSVGEYLSVEPAALDGCATFPAAGSQGAEYLLAPQLVSGTPGDTAFVLVQGNAAPIPMPLAAPEAAEENIVTRFDEHLRGLEAELALRPREPLPEQEIAAAPIQLDLSVGDLRDFKVCDKVTCRESADFATVTAEAKFVGDHAILYQDENAPSGGLTEADFEELGSLFDDDLYGVATRAFGSESDIDGNGRVIILLTPIVNGMTETAQCSQSYVTGFFFPLDVDPTAYRDNRSNQAELFYAIVPDPQGTVTCNHSVERIKRIVPVTFIHELQHMINYHQHVILRAGNSERTWLNESMSHMSEELAALYFESIGNLERFSAFSLGDLYNGFKYLKDPASNFLIYSEGTGTLAERGAGWLFLRWLVDQYGIEVLRRLSETSLTSTENVEAAAGEPISKLLTDWFLANYVSDHPDIDDVPDRLSYKTWNLREVYLALYSQDVSLFDRAFPIEPPVFSGGAFSVSGGLKSGSGSYLTVAQGNGQAGFTVRMLGEGVAPLSNESGVRLSVIRIR